jgi:hypothetical protein
MWALRAAWAHLRRVGRGGRAARRACRTAAFWLLTGAHARRDSAEFAFQSRTPNRVVKGLGSARVKAACLFALFGPFHMMAGRADGLLATAPPWSMRMMDSKRANGCGGWRFRPPEDPNRQSTETESKPMKTGKRFLSSIPAGVASAILSFVIGGYLIPFPADTLANAINNAVSGFISGLLGSFVSLTIFASKLRKVEPT